MGDSYVLGNREEDNQFKPYKVHPKMYEELPVKDMALGTQHVVVLTTANQELEILPEFEAEVLNFRLPEPVPVEKPKKAPVVKKVAEPKPVVYDKKRKRSDFEGSQEEEEKKDVERQENHHKPASRSVSPKPTPQRIQV